VEAFVVDNHNRRMMRLLWVGGVVQLHRGLALPLAVLCSRGDTLPREGSRRPIRITMCVWDAWGVLPRPHTVLCTAPVLWVHQPLTH
jgi:hypothetical protein